MCFFPASEWGKSVQKNSKSYHDNLSITVSPGCHVSGSLSLHKIENTIYNTFPFRPPCLFSEDFFPHVDLLIWQLKMWTLWHKGLFSSLLKGLKDYQLCGLTWISPTSDYVILPETLFISSPCDGTYRKPVFVLRARGKGLGQSGSFILPLIRPTDLGLVNLKRLRFFCFV